MSVAAILNYTYDDYKQWEGEWELIDGVPIAMAPAPTKRHQRLAGGIFLQLTQTFNNEVCPQCEVLYETDWKISDETVVCPDIVLACEDEGETYLTKAPKLIVEILSPSTAKKDETVKFELYEAEGVTYYILVYPDDLKAKVYRLNSEGHYIKVGDYTHELLELDEHACQAKIDFAQVFQSFRKPSA